jgi:hypothetical protein
VALMPDHAAGDILLLGVESANETVALGSAQGFVEVTNSPIGTGTASGTNATKISVFWVRATSGAMAAPTITNPGDHTLAVCASFRGCISTDNPWSTTTGDVAPNDSSVVTIPGHTAVHNEALVVLWATGRIDNSTPQFGDFTGELSNLTRRVNYATAAGNGGSLAMATGELALAGTFSVTTAPLNNAATQARFTMILQPPIARVNQSGFTWGYPQIEWADAQIDWVAPFEVG